MSASLSLSLLVVFSAAAAMSGAQNALKDVQIGEDGRLMRIALLCEKKCEVTALSDTEFSISNVESALEIPLQSRSTLVSHLKFRPDRAGSLLSVETERDLLDVAVNKCTVNGAKARCIDMEFAEAPVAPQAAASKTAAPEEIAATTTPKAPAGAGDAASSKTSAALAVLARSTPGGGAGAVKSENAPKENAPKNESEEKPVKKLAEKPARQQSQQTQIEQPKAQQTQAETSAPLRAPIAQNASAPEPEPVAAPAQPALRTEAVVSEAPPPPATGLRQAPNRDMLTFARLAAPERLAPPKLAVLTPASERPGLRLTGPGAPETALRSDFNIGEQARHILRKSLGVAECAGAQARLNEDAWALDAMIDVGFCKAAANEMRNADEIFSRLLAYTPDNYQALVGRALIAAKSGETGQAREYFQDALNAAPPLEASDRIIDAMAKL